MTDESHPLPDALARVMAERDRDPAIAPGLTAAALRLLDAMRGQVVKVDVPAHAIYDEAGRLVDIEPPLEGHVFMGRPAPARPNVKPSAYPSPTRTGDTCAMQCCRLPHVDRCGPVRGARGRWEHGTRLWQGPPPPPRQARAARGEWGRCVCPLPSAHRPWHALGFGPRRRRPHRPHPARAPGLQPGHRLARAVTGGWGESLSARPPPRQREV